MTKIPPRMIAAMVVMLASFPATAARVPWLLVRDGPHLRFLSPLPSRHPCIAPTHAWEGTGSRFDVEASDGELTIRVHLDAYLTPWWDDMQLVQHRDGSVWVTWDSTREDSDITFAKFRDFDTAWHDPRVRRVLAPVLCQLHQPLPTMKQLHTAIHPEPVSPETRSRIAGLLEALGSPDPRARRSARRALQDESYTALREARTGKLSVGQRCALEACGPSWRLTDGQVWLVLEMGL